MIRRLPLIPTLLVAAAVATMVGLGVWQLQRAEEKAQLIAQYESARGLDEIAFPTLPVTGERPLFRRATGVCLDVVGWRPVAGENAKGEVGYAYLADCRTGAEGPGMTVDAGWSKNPGLDPDWEGGEVKGTIAPDRKSGIRLVSADGLGGLEASAVPSTDSIPNNHLMYAGQWFLFALIALVIYGLAVRGRMKQGESE